MDSDDDFQSFLPPMEPSPLPNFRRLKRLKKSNSKISEDPLPEPNEDTLLFPDVDFAKLEALENDSELQFNESNSPEELDLSPVIENEAEHDDKLEFGSDLEVPKAKRVLEFDAEVTGGVYEKGKVIGECSGSSEPEKSDKEKPVEEREKKTKKKKREKSDYGDELKAKKEEREKKTKKKRSDCGDESKGKVRASNKIREEKERKAYLKELHAESQRLLRETRDASFKPVPVVQKPISSVLEKIRKRKLELSKSILLKDFPRGSEENIGATDELMDHDVSNEETTEENATMNVDEQSSMADSNIDKDSPTQTIHEHDQNQVLTNEESTPAFRAPVDDTQDLFEDSEPNGATAACNDELPSSPLEEDFAPSLLSMNLKFDSAPVDDSSSEEEDNDKENLDPHPSRTADASSSPKGGPIKDFIDDEAEEEDDSDNDLIRFQENEAADDIDDFEDLNDMIVTGHEEQPQDKERRDELHQKWLEQQDAAGTDNLMQRLKCASALRDTFLSGDESETDGDDEELDLEAEDSMPQKPSRVNIKKAKQIILELVSEKEDAYLSDDDDGTLRRHAHFIRKEEHATIVSPDDDASSKEVFGLIKKMNIASDNTKKPKAFSIFDSVLKGGNRDHSSKSSFLGRVSNHPLPSSHKHGSATVRSFIFGRDDSNSRSSMSISEDSSDTVSREARPTRNPTAKYSISQTKTKSQTRDATAGTLSKTSLLEILKRSSSQSGACNQDSAVDLTKSIFSFRATKKVTKIEGRS